MKCERCNKNLGEYKCSVCGKIICSDCKTIVNEKISCLDHSKETVKPKKTSLNILKKGIVAVFIVLIGVVLIFFITNYYIIKLELPPEISQLPAIMDILSLFESFGLHLIMAITGILVLLIVVFVIMRRRR